MTERLRRRRGNRLVLFATAVGASVVLAGVALAAAVDNAGQAAASDASDDDSGYVYPQAVPPTVPPTDWGTTTTYAPTPTTYAPVPSTDVAMDAGSQLQQLAAADLPVLRSSVEGMWVAQLSSKRLHMEVDGVYYDDEAILADHMALRSAYQDVRLAWSGDWVTFSAPDFWVTFVAVPYSTPEAANAWCDAQGLPSDACYAKRVSVDGGGDGNTVPR
jgi:hypothetical protein